MTEDQKSWDAIIIGSGMGGLACAAALAKTGHKALVLEQHYVAGGLTQTFHRSGFRWDVGVHYLGEMGPEGEARRILDWLAGGAIEFASLGAVYDIVHFPGNFEVQFPRTQAALQLELKERFPASAKDIDVFFAALADAERAGRAIFTERAMPSLLARIHGLWHASEVRKWWGRTCAEVLDELVSDPKLRAVLMAQRANYGAMAANETSFGVQALVTRHYFNGAYYPIGSAKAFADALVPAIEQGGGEIRLRAKVRRLLVENGAVVGVELDDATRIRAPRVFSDAGARNTVDMLPVNLRESEWAREILSFAPSPCHIALYLGLEGDIRANGATASNHWFHDTWDIELGRVARPGGRVAAAGHLRVVPDAEGPRARARRQAATHGRDRRACELGFLCAVGGFDATRSAARIHDVQGRHRAQPAGAVRAPFSGAGADGGRPRIVDAANDAFVHRRPTGRRIRTGSQSATFPLRKPARPNADPWAVPRRTGRR